MNNFEAIQKLKDIIFSSRTKECLSREGCSDRVEEIIGGSTNYIKGGVKKAQVQHASKELNSKFDRLKQEVLNANFTPTSGTRNIRTISDKQYTINFKQKFEDIIEDISSLFEDIEKLDKILSFSLQDYSHIFKDIEIIDSDQIHKGNVTEIKSFTYKGKKQNISGITLSEIPKKENLETTIQIMTGSNSNDYEIKNNYIQKIVQLNELVIEYQDLIKSLKIDTELDRQLTSIVSETDFSRSKLKTIQHGILSVTDDFKRDLLKKKHEKSIEREERVSNLKDNYRILFYAIIVMIIFMIVGSSYYSGAAAAGAAAAYATNTIGIIVIISLFIFSLINDTFLPLLANKHVNLKDFVSKHTPVTKFDLLKSSLSIELESLREENGSLDHITLLDNSIEHLNRYTGKKIISDQQIDELKLELLGPITKQLSICNRILDEIKKIDSLDIGDKSKDTQRAEKESKIGTIKELLIKLNSTGVLQIEDSKELKGGSSIVEHSNHNISTPFLLYSINILTEIHHTITASSEAPTLTIIKDCLKKLSDLNKIANVLDDINNGNIISILDFIQIITPIIFAEFKSLENSKRLKGGKKNSNKKNSKKKNSKKKNSNKKNSKKKNKGNKRYTKRK